ncbi:MAG: hypothetical protein JJT94_14555 [Bernardetiaceae bacterium]|nr:hypothetical protein [Bernardetiaceae bacterium]
MLLCANYVHTPSFFELEGNPLQNKISPAAAFHYCLLTRGVPTAMSVSLQERLGDPRADEDFERYYDLQQEGYIGTHLIKSKIIPTAVMRLQMALIWALQPTHKEILLVLPETFLPLDWAKDALQDFLNLQHVAAHIFKAEKLDTEILTARHWQAFSQEQIQQALCIELRLNIDETQQAGNHLPESCLKISPATDTAEKKDLLNTAQWQDFAPPHLVAQGEQSNREAMRKLLVEIFGYDDFHKGQFPLLEATFKQKNTLAALAHGQGKSLAFQMLSFFVSKPVVVFLPNKTALHYQIAMLERIGINTYASLDSDTPEQMRLQLLEDFDKARLSVLFLQPNICITPFFREQLLPKIQKKAACLVIDEAHKMCMNSPDFNSHYFNLYHLIRKDAKSLPLLALSASAAFAEVRVQLENDLHIEQTVLPLPAPSYQRRTQVLQAEDNKYPVLLNLVKRSLSQTNSILIFTRSVEGTEGCKLLSERLSFDLKTEVKYYSEELPEDTRIADIDHEQRNRRAYQEFFEGKAQVIVVASDFRIGINIPQEVLTVHYGMPPSLLHYYQESGKSTLGRHYIIFSPEHADADMPKALAVKSDIDTARHVLSNAGWGKKDTLKHLTQIIERAPNPDTDAALMLSVCEKYAAPNPNQLVRLSIKEVDFRMFETPVTNRLEKLGTICSYLAHLDLIAYWTQTDAEHIAIQTLAKMPTQLEQRCQAFMKQCFAIRFENRRRHLSDFYEVVLANEVEAELAKILKIGEPAFQLMHIAEQSDKELVQEDVVSWFEFIREPASQQLLAELKSNYGESCGIIFIAACMDFLNPKLEPLPAQQAIKTALSRLKKVNLLSEELLEGMLFSLAGVVNTTKKPYLAEVLYEYYESYLEKIYQNLHDEFSLEKLLQVEIKSLQQINWHLHGRIS